jgi:hypothetical protein
MTIDEWVLEVALRWPYRNNKSVAEIQTITDDLTSFSFGRSINELTPILSEFKSLKPPKGFAMWWFWDRVKKDESGVIWWRVCECNQIYQDRGSTCPVCGSYDFILDNGDTMPSETIEIQESCSACKWYKESLSNPMPGLYGNSCNEYGTEKHGKMQECKQCKCIDCCKMAYLYTHNVAEYKNMMGDLLEKKYKENGLEWAKKK